MERLQAARGKLNVERELGRVVARLIAGFTAIAGPIYWIFPTLQEAARKFAMAHFGWAISIIAIIIVVASLLPSAKTPYQGPPSIAPKDDAAP